MHKTATIFLHQLKTAVHPAKKLQQIWNELYELSPAELDPLLDDLDDLRQEAVTQKQDQMAVMLDELVTNLRIGIAPPRPKNVPKQF